MALRALGGAQGWWIHLLETLFVGEFENPLKGCLWLNYLR